ncbi:MAG: LysR substrate-binding domain-containing protein [Granulosicoccaceae bacterium]
MLRFTLRQLEYLIACVDTGSLVAAATQLNVSQPTISAAIAKLEIQLGEQLLIRHHAQGVVPCASAQLHIKTARHLLQQAADFQRECDSSGTELAGELTLGCFAPLAPTYLPGLIARLNDQYPGVVLKVFEGTQREIVEGLRAGKQQLGLVYDLDLPGGLFKHELISVQPQVLLRSDHKFAAKKQLSIKELATEPMVLLDVSPSRTYFTGLFESQGFDPIIAYRSSSLELVRGLVGRGLGYSILVTRPSGDTTYDGQKLAIRPLRDKVEPSRISLCGLESSRSGKISAAFKQVCTEYFNELTSPTN